MDDAGRTTQAPLITAPSGPEVDPDEESADAVTDNGTMSSSRARTGSSRSGADDRAGANGKPASDPAAKAEKASDNGSGTSVPLPADTVGKSSAGTSGKPKAAAADAADDGNDGKEQDSGRQGGRKPMTSGNGAWFDGRTQAEEPAQSPDKAKATEDGASAAKDDRKPSFTPCAPPHRLRRAVLFFGAAGQVRPGRGIGGSRGVVIVRVIVRVVSRWLERDRGAARGDIGLPEPGQLGYQFLLGLEFGLGLGFRVLGHLLHVGRERVVVRPPGIGVADQPGRDDDSAVHRTGAVHAVRDAICPPSGPSPSPSSGPATGGFTAATSAATSAVSGAAAGLASSVSSAWQNRGSNNTKQKQKPGVKVRKPAKRQAMLTLARLEPWSVMKFSFLASVVAFIILFVAVAVLYMVLSALGAFDSIQHFVTTLTSAKNSPGTNITHWFSASLILGYTAMLGAVNIVLITAMSTVGSVVYNLIAKTVGGVEVTLRETE